MHAQWVQWVQWVRCGTGEEGKGKCLVAMHVDEEVDARLLHLGECVVHLVVRWAKA